MQSQDVESTSLNTPKNSVTENEEEGLAQSITLNMADQMDASQADQMEASQIIDGVLDMLNEQARNISSNQVSQLPSSMCTHCGVNPKASSDESICETCWSNPGAVMALLQ